MYRAGSTTVGNTDADRPSWRKTLARYSFPATTWSRIRTVARNRRPVRQRLSQNLGEGVAPVGQFPQPPKKGAPARVFPPNTVKQGFPAARFDPAEPERSDTAWEVEWELTHPLNRPFYPPGSILRIKSAKFMWKDRTGKPQWITVARMLELAEIYVPYDNGWTAFLDIHDMPFHITPARPEYLGPSCVLPGEILKSPNPYWSGTGTLITIHNLAFQGLFDPRDIPKFGFHPDTYRTDGGFEFHGSASMLKAGLLSADMISTVSRRTGIRHNPSVPPFGIGTDFHSTGSFGRDRSGMRGCTIMTGWATSFCPLLHRAVVHRLHEPHQVAGSGDG